MTTRDPDLDENLIAVAITCLWGERHGEDCDDDNCFCCEAWKQYDDLKAAMTPIPGDGSWMPDETTWLEHCDGWSPKIVFGGDRAFRLGRSYLRIDTPFQQGTPMLETLKKLAELRRKRRDASTTDEFNEVSHAFDSVARLADFAAIVIAWEQMLAERSKLQAENVALREQLESLSVFHPLDKMRTADKG